MLKKSQLSGQLQNRETLQHHHYHHHPEDFRARLDPKHNFFSKSEEQRTRI
jgi:hypothetical protein